MVCTARVKSPNIDAFRAIEPGVEWCADWRTTIESTDAAVVCLPWDVTPNVVAELLACPKPILIEKPLALKGGDLKDLPVEGIKRVAFNRRFYEPVVALKERIETGGLRSAEVSICDSEARIVEAMGESIRPHLRAYHTVHMFDLVNWLFEPSVDHGKQVASAGALLRSKRCDAPVWIGLHRDAPVAWSIRCFFDDDSLWVLRPIEELAVFKGMDVRQIGTGPRSYTPVQIQRISAPAMGKPGFLKQMNAFLKGDQGPIPEDNLKALQLIEAIS